MRIFEIENNLTIWVTERFQKNFERNIKKDPAIIEDVRNFLIAKQRSEVYGAKDGLMSVDSPLAGVSICHLKYGKLLILYKMQAKNLYLYDMDEHKIIEDRMKVSTANYIKKISQDKLSLYVEPEVPITITKEQIHLLNTFLKDLISNSQESDDVGIQSIHAALDDDDWEFLQMFWSELDLDYTWDQIILALGGTEKLKKILLKKLNSPNKTFYESKTQETGAFALPAAVQHFIRNLKPERILPDDPKFVDIKLATGVYRIRYKILTPDVVWDFDKPQAWSMTREDAAIALHHWNVAELKHGRQLIAHEIMGDQNSENPVFVAVFL